MSEWADHLARRLDVDADQLEYFVDQHPSITVDVILEWADADERHRSAVEDALEAYERERTRERERRRARFGRIEK